MRLRDETVSGAKGEWSFISLGTGNVMVTAAAEGYLDSSAQAHVKQLEKNPPVKIILREDKEKRARVKDEASLLELDKEAQEFFTQSIALNPKDEILAYNVAEIFFGNNQTENAIQYYQPAIQIKPEWSEPYLKMGYAYLNKGDMAKAVASLNEFLKHDPESPQAPVIKSLIESLTKTK